MVDGGCGDTTGLFMTIDYFLERDSQHIANEIVIIDGFSSSGKSLIAAIFGYLERGEQWQIDPYYEDVAVLNYFGEVSAKTAGALLMKNADEHSYNLAIGRKVNFRKSDVSSPYANGLEERYIARLTKDDGDEVVDQIVKNRPILPLHAHYIFGYSDILLKGMGGRVKLYAEVLRDPFYLISAWHENGWPDKLCKRNRDFTLCFEYYGHKLPWYTLEYAERYISASSVEKSILTVFFLYSNIINMYNRLDDMHREAIRIVNFEKFCLDPDGYIDIFCEVLGTKRGNDFDYLMNQMSLPRSAVDGLGLERYLLVYGDLLKPEYVDILHDLDDKYRQFFLDVCDLDVADIHVES